MVVYDNGRVKAMTQASQVCIMTEDWQRIYITFAELAAIAEAIDAHLKREAELVYEAATAGEA